MFTNNYIKLQNMLFYNNWSFTFYDCTGSIRTAYDYNAPYYYGNIGYNMKYGMCKALVAKQTKTYCPCGADTAFGVYFGSGSTPASKDDYCLESPITSGLAITNPSSLAVSDGGDGKYTMTADFIVRNASEAEIDIREIGVFCPVCTYSGYWSSGSSSDWYTTLMERTVLDEPITIPAGEAKLVTYKVVFNQT